MQAGENVKVRGLENNLCELILADPEFMIDAEGMEKILRPENFTGRSEEQTVEFLRDCVQPILEANREILNETAELSV